MPPIWIFRCALVMRRSSPAACIAAAVSADVQNAWIEMRGTGAMCSSCTAASTDAAFGSPPLIANLIIGLCR
jgi:hypothetical protein